MAAYLDLGYNSFDGPMDDDMQNLGEISEYSCVTTPGMILRRVCHNLLT